ncbi:Integrase catalytic domain-containing protein [Citrus sinensis]|nr:Integrase catalytic domain-containing protein [Citrus sinensis]
MCRCTKRLLISICRRESKEAVSGSCILSEPAFVSRFAIAEEEFGFNYPMGASTIPSGQDTFIELSTLNRDLALRVDEPVKPTDKSTAAEKAEWAAWDESNRHCLDTMKYTIDRTTRDSIPACDKAKDYLAAVGRTFKKVDKAEKEESLKKGKSHTVMVATTQESGSVKKGSSKGSNKFFKKKKFGKKTSREDSKHGWKRKEFRSRREPNEGELIVHMGNGVIAKVESIGVVRLHLATGYVLDLLDTVYIPSIRRNLISVSILDRCGYTFHFGDRKVYLFCNSELVGSGTLYDGLYMIDLFPRAVESSSNAHVMHVVSSNRVRVDENSSMLWHKRLGKLTAKTRKERTQRSQQVLELVHTDICGPFTHIAIGGYKYFITFIDDFSRYGHVELLVEKSESLSVFQAFKANVELQKGKEIKAVRSDIGGEYYGQYDETGRNPGPFAKFLQECGIKAQYTMPGTPEQNGIVERRNRTLLDMVPSKSVPKTPYELWSGKRPSLRHFHVWGCRVEVRPYNPQSRKLDPKTISGHFIGYCIGSRGSRFYCPSHTTRIIESDRAIYFEDDHNGGISEPRSLTLREECVVLPIPSFPTSAMGLPHIDDSSVDPELHHDIEPMIVEDNGTDVPLRRSERIRRPTISDDYVVYLQEHDFDANSSSDPITFQEAISCLESSSWLHAMHDEMASMYHNGVWDLVELPDGCRPIGCKWVFKTKRDVRGQVERYKARLVAKGFSQREGIDYTKTYSPVSTKDSFRIIMALVAHFNLELHHMDVKTAFLNGSLSEDVYMVQPDGFVETGRENMCPDNDVDKARMQTVPYASVVGSLMYAQVCTRPDIAFPVGVLGRYLSNPGFEHWKAAKKVLRYLQATKDFVLTYQQSNHLNIVGYSDADFAGCLEDKKSTSGYIFMMAGGAISSRHS